MGALALALAVPCIVVPALPAASVPTARAASSLPPELVALEQKLAQLKVSSLRFSIEITITEAAGTKPAKGLAFVTAKGEVGDSPLRAQVDATTVGRHESVRVIGDTRFEYRPQIARHDGGRPWVYWKLSPSRRAKESVQRTFSELVKIPSDIALGQGASLTEELAQAQSVADVGPTTLDGQQVMQFNATLNPEIKQTPSSTPTLTEVFTHEPPPAEAPAQPAPTRTSTLEVFFAPSGLPVRTRLTVATGGSTLVADVDIPAIDIPVHIAAPAARATISRSRLRRLESSERAAGKKRR